MALLLSTQSNVTDSQIDPKSNEKNFLSPKYKVLQLQSFTITKFLLLRMKYIIDGGRLFDE